MSEVSLIAAEVAAGQGKTPKETAKDVKSRRVGASTSSSCVLRWILNGIHVPGVGRVRLEAVRCMGRWLTTEKAVARFLQAQTPRFSNSTEAPRSSKTSPRDVSKTLDRRGI